MYCARVHERCQECVHVRTRLEAEMAMLSVHCSQHADEDGDRRPEIEMSTRDRSHE